MARYKHVRHPDGGIGRNWLDTETGAVIPNDPDNMDRQRMLQWIAEGGVPDAVDVPEVPVEYSADERFVAQVQTASDVPVELWRYPTAQRTGYDIVIRLIAVDSGNGAVRKQSIDATVVRIGASPSLVGRTDSAPHQTGGARGTESGIGGWALNPSFVGYDLVLSVVGAVNRNVDWHATIGMVRFAPEGLM